MNITLKVLKKKTWTHYFLILLFVYDEKARLFFSFWGLINLQQVNNNPLGPCVVYEIQVSIKYKEIVATTTCSGILR